MATVAFLLAAGCAAVEDENLGSPAEVGPTTMFFNITSDPMEDPHPVTMALQLAGHALDDGRPTVLFFNVRGIPAVTKDFPADLAFHDVPIKELLANAMERGAEVHVCPHCMKAKGIDASALIPGAGVTDRESLFAHLGPNTVVFTY
jgi:predicted peroxiredoxin